MICKKCGFRGNGKTCSNCGGEMMAELTSSQREELLENAAEHNEDLLPSRLDRLMKKIMLVMLLPGIVLPLVLIRKNRIQITILINFFCS